MMTVEELRRAREESANVVYITFIKHIQAEKLGLFCFFEGKDSPYYVSRVKSVFQGNYYPINCTGKSKVLKIYELISYHREYDKYKKAFFIDKDFDISISNNKIYETPCYSIENLYTSHVVFGEILKSELGITEIDEDFVKCVNTYISLQSNFHEIVTLFNAWYACLIELKNATNQETGVSLEDNIPKEFIAFSLEGVIGNYDISSIREKYSKALRVDNEQIENKINLFNTQNKGQIFRGKFELNFMLKILNDLIADGKTTKQFISKNIKYNITNTQAISQFSQYAETPDTLLSYIKDCLK